MEIDPTNKKLLSLLQQDARQSATALGKALGLSRTAVQDRISRLEARGTIKGYTTVVADASKEQFEALLYVVIADRPCAPTLKWLRSLAGVTTVVSGDIDEIVWVQLSTAAGLSQFVDYLSNDEKVSSVRSQVILATY